jgi:hypothetical protein
MGLAPLRAGNCRRQASPATARPADAGPVHYCQSCDDPTAMEPREGSARCPCCGWVEEAGALMPLFIVAGASGAGKTAVFRPLARLLAGTAVTFDVDVLLDSAGMLSGAQPISWPGFRDAWLSVAHGVAQSGLTTVLLAPFIPQHLEQLPARRWVGDLHFLVLDCPEEARRQKSGGTAPVARPPVRRAGRVCSLVAREHHRPSGHGPGGTGGLRPGDLPVGNGQPGQGPVLRCKPPPPTPRKWPPPVGLFPVLRRAEPRWGHVGRFRPSLPRVVCKKGALGHFFAHKSTLPPAGYLGSQLPRKAEGRRLGPGPQAG